MLNALAILCLSTKESRYRFFRLFIFADRKITFAQVVPEYPLFAYVVGECHSFLELFNRLRKILKRHVNNSEPVIRLHKIFVFLNRLLKEINCLRKLPTDAEVVCFCIIFYRLPVFCRKGHLSVKGSGDQQKNNK